jgi:hypothetical protein
MDDFEFDMDEFRGSGHGFDFEFDMDDFEFDMDEFRGSGGHGFGFSGDDGSVDEANAEDALLDA